MFNINLGSGGGGVNENSSGSGPLNQNQLNQNVYTLRHIETGEYICLRQDGKEHLACFSDGDSAFQFRQELGLLEHVDISALRLGDTPFDQFWLNGQMRNRATAGQTANAN